MTKHKSKLSAKLVATITSLCACLAVLAVGVYATVTTFALEMDNQVKLVYHIENLDIYIYGKNAGNYYNSGYGIGNAVAGKDFFYDTGGNPDSVIATDGKYPIKLFGAGDKTIDTVSGQLFETLFNDWQQTAEFSDKTMAKYDTQKSISYVFSVMPSYATDTSDYAFSIYEKSLPTPQTPTSVFSTTYEYRVSIDGTAWGSWTAIPYGQVGQVGVRTSTEPDATAGAYAINFSNVANTAPAQKIVQIRATCNFSNENLKEVVVDDDWQFEIVFYTAQSITIGETLAQDGRILSENTNSTLLSFPLYVLNEESFELNPLLVSL